MSDAQAIAETQSEYVKIERKKVLDVIKRNRETHQKEWETAHAKWRERQIEKMEEYAIAFRAAIDKMSGGGKVEWLSAAKHILPEPMNRLKSYDKIIVRVDMCADEFIYLSHEDFDKFIMDEWHWKAEFTRTSAIYNV